MAARAVSQRRVLLPDVQFNKPRPSLGRRFASARSHRDCVGSHLDCRPTIGVVIRLRASVCCAGPWGACSGERWRARLARRCSGAHPTSWPTFCLPRRGARSRSDIDPFGPFVSCESVLASSVSPSTRVSSIASCRMHLAESAGALAIRLPIRLNLREQRDAPFGCSAKAELELEWAATSKRARRTEGGQLGGKRLSRECQESTITVTAKNACCAAI